MVSAETPLETPPDVEGDGAAATEAKLPPGWVAHSDVVLVILVVSGQDYFLQHGTFRSS